MKYVSIDIETSSDHPDTGSILSFGAVIEDTENMLPLDALPKFEVYINNEEPIRGTYYALQMNSEILRAIATEETDIRIIKPEWLETFFAEFLVKNGFEASTRGHTTITVAGKNFEGFDAQFIEKLNWGTLVRIRKRVLDPAPLFVNFKTDDRLPDLKTCKERAGIKSEVSHKALEDALDVIAVLRTKYEE